MKNKFDFLTGRNNPYLKDYHGHLVHDEMIPSFKLLQELAKNEIGADIQIISSFRAFDRQEIIWNNKTSGVRDIYDDHDQKVDTSKLSKKEIVQKIMRFSALPGASRHHWGTDLDIFDASKLPKENVALTPSECGPGDIFCELHEWLDIKMGANNAFGFYRPYAQDLGGVSIEKWHISYSPLSSECFKDYSQEIFQRNIEESSIELKDTILKDLDFYYKNFITNITIS